MFVEEFAVNAQSQTTRNLKPTLGLFDATAISVGAIVGAGIFVVIGIAAGLAGPAMILSILAAAAVSLVTALSLAELSSWLPKEGGVYEFAHELLSPYLGFITGWMWMLSNTFTGAAVSLGFAYYFSAVFHGIPAAWLAAAVCLLFTYINYIGLRRSASLNNILVVAKLSVLAFFVVFGLSHFKIENLSPFVSSSSGVLYATVFIFFAFGGFARVAVVAEEVKDARRNVPKAILLSLLISTVFYILVGVVAIGLVGAPALSSSKSPLTSAIEATGATWTAYVVSVGGLLATASVLLTSVLGVSRVAYSMGRRGELPRALSNVHGSLGTPYYSVWATGILMAVLVLLVDLQKVVAVSTFSLLFYYGAANAAALRLKPRDRLYPPAVPVIGLVACFALLVFVLFASPGGWMIGVAGVFIGTAFYYVWNVCLNRQAGKVP
jgi:APA family basic amino acid/polyamine antiporter